jgi:RNA polymerase sigma factor (TIGR02999 family)
MPRLVGLVYDELRRIAHWQRIRERDDHTLNTTALVHEAFLRLVDTRRVEWKDRGHFFAVAAGAMRRILIDYARRYRSAKRGGGQAHVPLEEDVAALEHSADTVIAVDEALVRLESVDARLCRVVECRYFAGLTDEDTAAALGLSLRTVRRDWSKAKAWLYQELKE